MKLPARRSRRITFARRKPGTEQTPDPADYEHMHGIADDAFDGSSGSSFASAPPAAAHAEPEGHSDGNANEDGTDAPAGTAPPGNAGSASKGAAGQTSGPGAGLAPATLAGAGKDGGPPTDTTPEEDEEDADRPDLHMSLREHLIELRGRLLRCVVAVILGFMGAFYFAPMLRDLMLEPLKQVLPPGGAITFINLTEPFMVDMRIALVIGIFAASPYIFYQIWAFIAPGLYSSERKYVVPVALCSAFFFIAGGLFCYFVAFRFAFSFLAWYGGESLKASITLENQFDLTLRLLLAFGCIFEMPLFSFFLAKLGIVTAKKLRAWRKYSILVNFMLAAIITPPDVYSQLLMAIPLLLLYEFSILVAAFFGKPEEDAEAKEPEKQADPA